MTGGRQIRVELPKPFTPGMVKLAFVEGQQILIVNVGGTLRAIANSCPHAGSSLYGGKLIGAKIRCPSHGLMIDLVTGCAGAVGGLSTPVFAVEEIDGLALVTLDEPGD
ncbi:MAG: Rieske 2Fe-2S domain-containing protein [Sphingomonadales bacterium]|nr:Rieske 2Fe-2S domain-containing protein [Sphingomonadales bacterium]